MGADHKDKGQPSESDKEFVTAEDVRAPRPSSWQPEIMSSIEFNAYVDRVFSGEACFLSPDGPLEIGAPLIGAIAIESGLVAVHDPGLMDYDVIPLDQTVPPGTHRVEVAVDSRSRPAMVRVVFSENLPSHFIPAVRSGDGPFTEFTTKHTTVGVDSGRIAIFDPKKSSDFQNFDAQNLELKRNGIGLGPLGSAFIVPSCDGDGAYPGYWGIGEYGNCVCLIIDFCTLGEFCEIKVQTCFTADLIGQRIRHDWLDRLGYHVTFAWAECEDTILAIQERSNQRIDALVINPNNLESPVYDDSRNNGSSTLTSHCDFYQEIYLSKVKKSMVKPGATVSLALILYGDYMPYPRMEH